MDDLARLTKNLRKAITDYANQMKSVDGDESDPEPDQMQMMYDPVPGSLRKNAMMGYGPMADPMTMSEGSSKDKLLGQRLMKRETRSYADKSMAGQDKSGFEATQSAKTALPAAPSETKNPGFEEPTSVGEDLAKSDPASRLTAALRKMCGGSDLSKSTSGPGLKGRPKKSGGAKVESKFQGDTSGSPKPQTGPSGNKAKP